MLDVAQMNNEKENKWEKGIDKNLMMAG